MRLYTVYVREYIRKNFSLPRSREKRWSENEAAGLEGVWVRWVFYV